MSIAEMRTWFDILQDKANDPYFTDAEKDEFLEDAQWDIINEIIGDYQNAPIVGANKTIATKLAPLIERVTLTTAADGKVTDTLINTASILTGNKILILELAPATGESANFNNFNSIGKVEANTYKAGTATAPNYTIENGFAQMYPAQVYTSMTAVIVAAPTAIDDLPEDLHRKQVAKALVKTGLVTEAQALTLMEQPTNG